MTNRKKRSWRRAQEMVLHLLLAPFAVAMLLTQNCQLNTVSTQQIQQVLTNPPAPDILTHEGIDSVLAQFETVSYKELKKLDTAYINYSDPLKKFGKKFKNLEYHVVVGYDIYKKVVGPFRVGHFLSQDRYFGENIRHINDSIKQYWSADKEVLHMLLDLILELKNRGHNEYGFVITAGHRHPLHNMIAKGSGDSQHQYGTAIDLAIKDINKDGKATDEDKQIVLEILEEIVGDEGGLGLYPGSMSVHMDCRGFKARWNSYKSPY